MKKRTWQVSSTIVLLLAAVTALAVVGVVKAEERAFTLPWSVIGSGGMGGSADGYTLHSTLGQPVAGSAISGDYALTSGFWAEIVQWFENFLPLILR